ncbi:MULTISPECIES: SMI1/KNR4 family protein [unclassified Streptomyces]|uniref:SMI1/KNR4 family protein n=1 Tax=unclassified Streptomyces TaxID=2593676 RepID=UPI002E824739|nr:SMI1/KNR4 family protein [Streptomyces sp. NBC_00589]WTI33632.1 SMI1/KNR4 family protein [Streptomyces sp. NBC_00775]WUB32696.1 SMI1/KNR4 family protein [Streptomyces sp. NBC_00589]
MKDDLIGTQTPKRRITDPGEALATLERAVPGLTEHRRSEPAVLDWAVIEESLGTALPSDYKHLAEWYPTFAIGDFLLVGLPEPGEEHHILQGICTTLQVLAEAWLEPALGLLAHPAPGGLLPWAESNESDKFMWSTTGATPQDWIVTVASRSGGWWHYSGGSVQFLAEYCDGTLEPWALPPIEAEVTPC